jgi:hypothetical protein
LALQRWSWTRPLAPGEARRERLAWSGLSREIEFHLVDIAPAPILSRLKGPHDGVLGGVKVFGGVPVLGRIAATHVAARHAQAEVDPSIPHLEALGATVGLRLHFTNLIRVVHCFMCLSPNVLGTRSCAASQELSQGAMDKMNRN